MANVFVLCLIIFLVTESVTPFRLHFQKSRESLESEEESTTEDVSTTNETTVTTSTTSTTSTSYPPYDPNDACHGCPAGQSCQMVIPPCLRPPEECRSTTPDPSLDCAQYENYCKPIPVCLDVIFG